MADSSKQRVVGASESDGSSVAGVERRAAVDAVPLVVDLDGTLVQTDLLYETLFDAISRSGWRIFDAGLWGRLNRQGIKVHLAGHSKIDYDELPYSATVLAYIVKAKDEGRKVYLATASDRLHADGVAASLGLFDGVFASSEAVNLKGERKADVLIEAFGAKGFDYIGNDASDLSVWRHARQAISIGLPARISRTLAQQHSRASSLGAKQFDFRALFRAMRPHQFAKNLLIFVPLLTAHEFTPAALFQAILAFIAFSICASGVYILNDLLDIQADRRHPTKKGRPFAAGRLSLRFGLALAPALTLASFAVGALVSPTFLWVLAIYYAITNAYSLALKRRKIVDVVTLAMLYTIRVVAGAAAIDVVVSEWLFAFSLMIFTTLALIKRYTELADLLEKGLADPENRDYRKSDLPIIAALAAGAGMNSITILALYVSSPEVVAMYSRPHILWALCPLFLYWVARAVMLAHRRQMPDDPIVFALRDSRSWAVGVAAIILVLTAH